MTTFKTLVKTTLTPIAICLSIAIASPAMAERDQHKKHDAEHRILSGLSLTATQKQDIKLVFKQNREDRASTRADDKSLRTELRSIIQSTDWNQTAAESALARNQALLQEKALQRASNRNQVWNLLTAAQQAEFIAQLEDQKSNRKEKNSEGKKKEKGQRRGKRGGEKLKHLDLTEQQLASVKAINTEAKINSEKIRGKLKSYLQAEQSLIQSANFTSEAWQTLNSEYQADLMAIAIVKAKSQHDIWNLMTPEQQTKASENFEKDKSGKRKHGGDKKDRQHKRRSSE